MSDNFLSWEQAVLWLRAQPEQQELVRACYYDDPLLDAAIRFQASEEWQAVLGFLPRNTGRALDLGAGRGISSYALAKAGWQVTALEPDPSPIVGREAIRLLAEQTILPIVPLDGYAEKIPCADSQFDLAYGRQVMHHAQNLQTMCSEISRTLKPGGTLIVTREHVLSRKEDLHIFLKDHPLHHLYGGEYAYLLEEYLQAIRRSGLKIIRKFGPLDTPINYFPLTFEQVKQAWELPLSRLIGKATARTLTENLPLFNKIMAGFFSRRNQYPGRLYTIIAVKPRDA